LRLRVTKRLAAEAERGRKKTTRQARRIQNSLRSLRLDDLSLEIGFQLIPLVDEKQGGQMLGQRCKTLCGGIWRRRLGFLVPPVHISDNLRLKAREYVVSLRGIEVGRWQMERPCTCWLSQPRRVLARLPGKETREPAFGAPAVWIQLRRSRKQALAAGYSVVDAGDG
jgi:flagellar biosynthesis protein FlhA